MYTLIYVYIYIYICIYAYIHIYIHIYKCIHILIYICMFIYIYIYVYIYICKYISIYSYVYTQIHIHSYIYMDQAKINRYAQRCNNSTQDSFIKDSIRCIKTTLPLFSTNPNPNLHTPAQTSLPPPPSPPISSHHLRPRPFKVQSHIYMPFIILSPTLPGPPPLQPPPPPTLPGFSRSRVRDHAHGLRGVPLGRQSAELFL